MLLPFFLSLDVTHAQEILNCRYEEETEGKTYSIELQLALDKGRITQLAYSGSISTGVEGQAYSCNLDTSNVEFLTAWTEKGPLTILTVTQPDRTDTIQIEKKDKEFEVRFVDVGRYYCGFGAEFPAAVTLISDEEFCKVQAN